MLTLDGLKVAQGEFRLSADLVVKTSAITAVIGPSGGGKSTLLNCIAGFTPPQFGRVIWDGDDITELAPGTRPISVIFQDNNLFGHMSAFDNIAIGLLPSLRLSEVQKDQVLAALDSVGLGGLAARKPAALSGGQQSRVALARVLVRGRPILLLDEPFAALGPALRGEMLDLVAKVAGTTNATVLMVSHDPADAMRIADETIYVEAGEVAKPLATDALMAGPPKGMRAYLGS